MGFGLEEPTARKPSGTPFLWGCYALHPLWVITKS